MNMFFVPVGLLTKSGLSMSDRISDALIMLVKGMFMVFAVLSILMGVIILAEKVLAGKKKSSEKSAEKQVEASAVEEVVDASDSSDDSAIVAAITAAISVVLEQTGTAPANGFRVVSFKRVGKRAAWNSKR